MKRRKSKQRKLLAGFEILLIKNTSSYQLGSPLYSEEERKKNFGNKEERILKWTNKMLSNYL